MERTITQKAVDIKLLKIKTGKALISTFECPLHTKHCAGHLRNLFNMANRYVYSLIDLFQEHNENESFNCI